MHVKNSVGQVLSGVRPAVCDVMFEVMSSPAHVTRQKSQITKQKSQRVSHLNEKKRGKLGGDWSSCKHKIKNKTLSI